MRRNAYDLHLKFILPTANYMTIPVLICDDSSLARKQMARSLPVDWDIELSFACNGVEAIEAIRAGKADVMFLDLNMPVMNGYEVLDAIRFEDLPTMVMVVSGDVQPEAYKHVMSKGALDFVKKPVSNEKIRDVLVRFGIVSQTPGINENIESVLPDSGDNATFSEALQEVVNVAMGQAGGRLAEQLDTFIQLPVPIVHVCPYGELTNRLACRNDHELTGVSHGFSGGDVAGEAILIVGKSSFPPLIAQLQEESGDPVQQELAVLIDLSGLLTGACLQGMSAQLDLDLNHSFPVMLGRTQSLQELLGTQVERDQVVAVEINYQMLEGKIQCHLVLLITNDSIERLLTRLELL